MQALRGLSAIAELHVKMSRTRICDRRRSRRLSQRRKLGVLGDVIIVDFRYAGQDR